MDMTWSLFGRHGVSALCGRPAWRPEARCGCDSSCLVHTCAWQKNESQTPLSLVEDLGRGSFLGAAWQHSQRERPTECCAWRRAANVLLKATSADRRGYLCKLGDFGLARLLDPSQHTHVSTQTYGALQAFSLARSLSVQQSPMTAPPQVCHFLFSWRRL